MKIPARPPAPEKVVQDALSKDINRLAVLIAHRHIVDEKGRYLNWDSLRFKKPPADLSSLEWWAMTRLARGAASQRTPLSDKSGMRFAFCEPASLKSVLRNLDMRAGGALASDETALPSGEGRLYLSRSLAEEPFASSFIEGAATTRQIAKKLILEGRAPRTKDERMVLNNYHAMQFVKLHKDDPFSLKLLLELHNIVTEDTLDDPHNSGRIRVTDDIQVVDETNSEILHQPPLAKDLPKRLEKLMGFANEKPGAVNWIHPLVRAFILHFMLSYEHPFVDGNGRVARALFYWSALRAGYWLIEYVSISSIIAESKISYGRAFLDTEIDRADLTYFLIYHAKILDAAVERLMQFVDRKRREVAAFEKRIGGRHRTGAFNHRQSWLLNEFARGRRSRITIEEHQKRNAVSYLTARKDLETLVDAKCLRKRKAGKSSIYTPVNDLVKVLAG